MSPSHSRTDDTHSHTGGLWSLMIWMMQYGNFRAVEKVLKVEPVLKTVPSFRIDAVSQFSCFLAKDRNVSIWGGSCIRQNPFTEHRLIGVLSC